VKREDRDGSILTDRVKIRDGGGESSLRPPNNGNPTREP
jgi:hypothetical protein